MNSLFRLPQRVSEDQADWMRKRALCAFKVKHRECLLTSLKSRVKELEKLQ
jgi:hypothetical protein